MNASKMCNNHPSLDSRDSCKHTPNPDVVDACTHIGLRQSTSSSKSPCKRAVWGGTLHVEMRLFVTLPFPETLITNAAAAQAQSNNPPGPSHACCNPNAAGLQLFEAPLPNDMRWCGSSYTPCAHAFDTTYRSPTCSSQMHPALGRHGRCPYAKASTLCGYRSPQSPFQHQMP